jgi:nicotinamide-nucleotide amidase
MLPRGTEMIENTAGTAPGIYCNYQSGDQKTLCPIFIMPGVPKEMKIMFARSILPRLTSAESGLAGPISSVILSKTLHTFGLGESAIADKIPDLMRRDRNPSVGTTVANGYVSLRINAYASSRGEAERELSATEAAARAALGKLIWGEGEDTLQDVVAALLKKHKKSLTTAESCTGGLLAKYLTDVPGSSAYFKQGWITYSNEAKTDLLGVDAYLIKAHGAVSDAVAREMAVGALKRAAADFALAVSGIAGPDGGSAEKPVGTVSIALARTRGDAGAVDAHARTFIFHGDREMIRDRSAKMALMMLRYHLMGDAFLL